MLYRETGQFNTSYEADQRIFRIVQDRWLIAAILVTGAVVVPLLATEYFYTEIMIPFLILSLAAVGLNILVGYRSEEHTSELQSLMRISYAVFCLKKTHQSD